MNDLAVQVDDLAHRMDIAEQELAATKRAVQGPLPRPVADRSLEDRVTAIERLGIQAIVGSPALASYHGAPSEYDHELVVNEVVFLTLAVTSGTETANTGDATTKCAYTYDVEDALTGYKYFGDGTDPAVAAVDPTAGVHKWVRPTRGFMLAATLGYAYRNATGALVIGWINEVADQEACGGETGNTYDQGTW